MYFALGVKRRCRYIAVGDIKHIATSDILAVYVNILAVYVNILAVYGQPNKQPWCRYFALGDIC